MSWTSADLPSFVGRSVIVTGANSGLGLVTARELARVGARVILACRDIDRGDAAASGMTGDVQVRRLDLQNLASVRDFADSIAVVDGAGHTPHEEQPLAFRRLALAFLEEDPAA